MMLDPSYGRPAVCGQRLPGLHRLRAGPKFRRPRNITEAVARAPADGYTLLLVDSSGAINATLYGKLTYDFIRDIAPSQPSSACPWGLAVERDILELVLFDLVERAVAGRAS